LISFLDDFRKRHGTERHDGQILLDFHNTFSQLIAQLLTKPLECSQASNSCDTHSPFLQLVRELAESHIIHFHTLNHDLFMEYLICRESLRGWMDDGFADIGSPFFAGFCDKYERYTVRLPLFANKFKERLRLYKLHGSVDRYWVRHNNHLILIKKPSRISNMTIFKEVEKDDVSRREEVFLADFPDFLSGMRWKIELYDADYYRTVFDHFKNNLRSSDALIIIGYGFRDDRINEYIEGLFCKNGNRPMFVVDEIKPCTDFLKRDNTHFLDGGVSGMNIKSIVGNMST